jgi:mono/diheme cytochrome c family protein
MRGRSPKLRTNTNRGRASARAGSYILLLCAALLTGCRQDMQDQPKFIPLRPSSFFDDGRSERPLVEGTVARGHLDADTAFYTGKVAGKPVDTFPFPITRAVLNRGQERFNIYCAPCHDRLGNGLGMIVRRGFDHPPPPSYHIDRLRQAPDGYLFDVITNGLGAMPDYAAQINPGDRWAIVAYVRALQYSQHASVNDVPADARTELTKGGRQ